MVRLWRAAVDTDDEIAAHVASVRDAALRGQRHPFFLFTVFP
jgi:hypothetical protein